VNATMRRAATVLATAAALAVAAAVPALAASDHGQNGTEYSPCGTGKTWYESSNARTKSGTGLVKLEFSDINPGGIDWKLLGKSNQQYGSEQEWTSGETGIWRTLDSSMANGTVFYNDFRDQSTSCNQSDYSFTGTEYY
jgi:hypothetical protein